MNLGGKLIKKKKKKPRTHFHCVFVPVSEVLKSTCFVLQVQGQMRGGVTSSMSGGLPLSSAPAEYSPFNNFFTQLQDRVINKKVQNTHPKG